MENLMNRMVVDILSNPENYDKKKKEDHDDKMSAMMGTDRSCDLCGDYPCVWIVQRAAVVANDERTHTYNIENKTRRKVGYRHMFRVVNGGREKEFENASRNASKLAFGPSSQTINTWDSWRRE
jgi:hypothetical protein